MVFSSFLPAAHEGKLSGCEIMGGENEEVGKIDEFVFSVEI